MKALILAAGNGVRMMPLTKDRPKCLIEVAGKPFLQYVFQSLDKAGIEDIYMVVGNKMAQIKDFVEDFGKEAKFIIQKEVVGTGNAVLQAKDLIKEDFIVLMGDNLYSPADIVAMAKSDEFSYVSGFESSHPQDYGVLITDGEFLERIDEKPEKPKSSLVNTGLYKFTPEIFKALEKIKKSSRGEYELTDAITLLAKEKKVKVIKMEEYWIDMSIKEKLPDVEQQIRELVE